MTATDPMDAAAFTVVDQSRPGLDVLVQVVRLDEAKRIRDEAVTAKRAAKKELAESFASIDEARAALEEELLDR